MKLGSQGRNRDEVMRRVFQQNWKPGAKEVPFTMDDVRIKEQRRYKLALFAEVPLEQQHLEP